MIELVLNPGESVLLQALGKCLVHSIWQFLAIAFLVALVSQLVGVRNSQARYWIFLTGLASCLFASAITLAVNLGGWDTSQVSGLERPSPAAGPVNSTTDNDSVARDAEIRLATSSAPTNQEFITSVSSDKQETQPVTQNSLSNVVSRAAIWAVPFWFVGVVVMSLRPLLGVVKLYRIRRLSSNVSPELRQRFQSLLAKKDCRASVSLLQSASTAVPLAFGFLRSCIVVPTSCLTSMTAAELDAVLLHELAHLVRWDPWFNLFQVLCETVFFYHPAIWWMSKAARAEREHCCDEFACAGDTGSRYSLANALLKLESEEVESKLALAANEGDLLRRIRRIAGQERSDRVSAYPWLAGLMSLTLVALILFVGNQEANGRVSGYAKAAASEPVISKEPPPTRLMPEDQLNKERTSNDAAYEKNRKRLKQEHQGEWVLIANGEVTTGLESLEQAHQVGLEKYPNAQHRYLFRAGVDDVEMKFNYSPWSTTPNWWQLGRKFRRDHKLNLGPASWSSRGNVVSTPNGKAMIGLAAIDDPKNRILHSAVCSALNDHQVTLTEKDAKKLKLGRFEVPVMATNQPYRDVSFRKVHVLVTQNELKIEQAVLGFVAPDKIVNKDPSNQLKADLEAKVKELEQRFQEKQKAADLTWVISGKVTDVDGKPIQGATVKVFTGVGSLRQSQLATSDNNGAYKLKFRTGGTRVLNNSPGVMAATVFVSLDGYAETNLCRQGDRLIARHDEFQKTAWGDKDKIAEKLILPNQPVEINFQLERSATIQGYVTDPDNRGFAKRTLYLVGPELPPSSSVMAQTRADSDGKFEFKNVPLNRKWRFEFSLPSARKSIESDYFELREPESIQRQLIVSEDKEQELGYRLKVVPLEDNASRRIQIESRNRVFGNSKPMNEKLNWGDEKNGLQAALIGFEKTIKAGTLVQPKVVVRNVSQKTIRFESTRWRQEDRPKCRVDGKRIRENRVWYSGWPRIQLIELEPGQEIELTMAGVYLAGKNGKSKDAAPYQYPYATGAYELMFRLKLPDVGNGDEGDWTGTLETGTLQFTVTD